MREGYFVAKRLGEGLVYYTGCGDLGTWPSSYKEAYLFDRKEHAEVAAKARGAEVLSVADALAIDGSLGWVLVRNVNQRPEFWMSGEYTTIFHGCAGKWWRKAAAEDVRANMAGPWDVVSYALIVEKASTR
jgi:hypothetical protein